MIKEYRKLPVVIEAIQYNNLNREEIEEFIGKKLKQELESETAYLAGKGTPKFSITIPTLEGDMKAMPNDYIIKGLKGEFYPCKPDAFSLGYEMVESHITPAGNKCNCIEGENEEEMPVELILNARPVEWNRKDITYDEIVKLADKMADFTYTVCYSRAFGGKNGSLIKGEMVSVKNGTIINISNTNNA